MRGGARGAINPFDVPRAKPWANILMAFQAEIRGQQQFSLLDWLIIQVFYVHLQQKTKKSMEKTLNRVGTPISVVGRGVRSFIRWHSPEEEQRMLEQARKAYAELHS